METATTPPKPVWDLGHWRPADTVQSKRLLLRKLHPGDVAAVYAYGADPEVTRYVSFATHASEADAAEFVKRARSGWRAGSMFVYAIEVQGKMVGAIDIRPVAAGILRLGYALRKSAWGNGYGAEAVTAVLPHALGAPGVTLVEALVHPDNKASMKVLEKAGFAKGHLAPRCGVLPNLGRADDVWTYLMRP